MEIEDFTVLMKALSDPNRVRALLALNSGELCVCQLIELFQLAPSTVSKHMSILRQAKLVESRKDGRWIYYSIAKNRSEMVDRLFKLVIASVSVSKEAINDKEQLGNITQCNLDDLCRKQRGEKCCV